MRRLAKTGSYWLVHISVAIAVAWALTGNLAAALAIGLLEPSVQAVVFYAHEWLWDRNERSTARLGHADPCCGSQPATVRIRGVPSSVR